MSVLRNEQTALTALRDEFRKVFEPFGMRIEQFDIQLGARALRWRSRTPDYPSHHIGGAFEEWNIDGRTNKHHRITVVVVRDEALVNADNVHEHAELLAGRWVPERLSMTKISELLNAFGVAIVDPEIHVLPVASIWNSAG